MVLVGLCVLVLLIAGDQGDKWLKVLVALATMVSLVVANVQAWQMVVGWFAGPPGLPAALDPPVGLVDRPEKLAEVVEALCKRRSRTAGITTVELYGAGGFGKTTLAQVACANRRVEKWFRKRVYWVDVGQDVREPAAVAAKVIYKLSGKEEAFPDLASASQRLRKLLGARPRTLLVLDDVWEKEQLAAFTGDARRCVLLVTTRIPGLLNEAGALVEVDRMLPGEARDLLTSGAHLPEARRDELLEATAGWPLVLRIIGAHLADTRRLGGNVDRAAGDVLAKLRVGGHRALDILNVKRAATVQAAIDASASLLDDPQDAERLAELGVFAEGEVIPFELVFRLWRATGGLDSVQAQLLCERLASLALVSDISGVRVHPVIRDSLRRKLGPQRLAGVNGIFLDRAAGELPAAPSLNHAVAGQQVAWWWKPDADDDHAFMRYLRDHLIEHLRDAGRPSEAEAVACDLRWAGVRLTESGPAALSADLSRAGTPRARSLLAVLARMSHLLAATQPPSLVADVLYCRVADDPDWGQQATALRSLGLQRGLAVRWPLPDIPGPALRRILTGQASAVNTVAVAPDGSWLAAGDDDGAVQIWEPATGRKRADFPAHSGAVNTVAVAPDGRWLATGGDDGTARIWDTHTWKEQQPALAPRTGLTARTGAGGRTALTVLINRNSVRAVALAPDGSWLAAGSNDGTVRIWDHPAPANKNPAARRQRLVLTTTPRTNRAALTGISALTGLAAFAGISAVAFNLIDVHFNIAGAVRESFSNRPVISNVRRTAPATNASRLATGNLLEAIGAKAAAARDGVRDVVVAVSQRGATTVTGVHDVIFSPIGYAVVGICLLVVSVRLWKAIFPVLTRHVVTVLAVAPDGGWLATGGTDGKVQVWNQATGKRQSVINGRRGAVNAVAYAPDGSWLATGGNSKTVRIRNQTTGEEKDVQTGHDGAVNAVVFAPDSSWLATGGDDKTVRIWDQASGEERAVLTGHSGVVNAMAVAPDGSWLATGAADGTVRIWDPDASREQADAASRVPTVNAVAAAPDGSWLATGGDDKTVRIWDRASGEERAVLTGHSGAVNAVAVERDGRWLATGGDDGKVRIWDQVTGEKRAVLTGHAGAVTSVTFAPDSGWLATGGEDGTVRIWDQVSGEKRAVRTKHSRALNAVPIAPDGSSPTIDDASWAPRTWKPRTAEWKRGIIFGYDFTVNVIAIAPGNSWLVASTGGARTHIWDAVTGRERNRLTLYRAARLRLADIWNDATRRKAKTRDLIEATGMTAAAIAPDGGWLATVSSAGAVRIWDAVTLREQAALPGHSGAVNTVAVAPDGTWLATGSADGTLRVWGKTATWSLWTLMRVDGAILSCTWIGNAGLAVVGAAGLFTFDFPAGTEPSPVKR